VNVIQIIGLFFVGISLGGFIGHEQAVRQIKREVKDNDSDRDFGGDR
jgi:hypothetical protein